MRYQLHQILVSLIKHNGLGCAGHLAAIGRLHHNKRMVGITISARLALTIFQQSSDHNVGKLHEYFAAPVSKAHCLAAAKKIY